MPHTCSGDDCPRCYLRINRVTAFHCVIKLSIKGEAIAVETIHMPGYLKEREATMIYRVACAILREFYDTEGREPRADESVLVTEPFFTCSLSRTEQSKIYTFSFVTFPKPKARAPINQDPRAAATTALPPVAPEEGDDPSDSSE